MKIGFVGVAAALLVSLMATGPSVAKDRRHLSPDGRTCITFTGIKYDKTTDWNNATWSNDCDFIIRINYSRVDPETGQTKENYTNVRAGSTASAILFKSTEVEWWEHFPD